MRKLFHGEKGFTLVELLVVVAILGVLAAVAIPNVGKFIGKGKNEAAETELHNVETCVMAGMADSGAVEVNNGSGGQFGNTSKDPSAPTPTDLEIITIGAKTYKVGDYITGGVARVQGLYTIAGDGSTTQDWYPGLK